MPSELNSKPIISAVLFPESHFKIAKTFWQHSGDGISSRRAEYCHKAFSDGRLVVKQLAREQIQPQEDMTRLYKGPRRYQKKPSVDITPESTLDGALEGRDYVQFIEERFGRNLDLSLADNAKLAIRRRIAGVLTANLELHEALAASGPPSQEDNVDGLSEHDIYLHPSGMSSIFNTHRSMMACRGKRKSISFGLVLF